MLPIYCRLPPHRQRLGRVPYQGARTAAQDVFNAWLLHAPGPLFVGACPYSGPSAAGCHRTASGWAAFCIAGAGTAAHAVLTAESAVAVGPPFFRAGPHRGPSTASILRLAARWAAFGGCVSRVWPIGLRTQRPRSEMGCSAFHRAPDACKSALPDPSGRALATM